MAQRNAAPLVHTTITMDPLTYQTLKRIAQSRGHTNREVIASAIRLLDEAIKHTEQMDSSLDEMEKTTQ